MVNSDYLKGLNDSQKEAVLCLDGPLLIVAGAGSGKTKVLTSRIAHIIKENRAFPNQVLAVTFTNKAAKEMQSRVSKILGSSAFENQGYKMATNIHGKTLIIKTIKPVGF